jgi:acetoin utilization deacetylase AcuC-like enzyme
MRFVFDPTFLEYEIPDHPESPGRVKRIVEALGQNFTFLKPSPVSEEDIEKVHTKEHWKKVRDGKYSDPDTPQVEIKYPLLSAGSAIKAADVLGFSISRPPGHHAGKDFLGGFCYLNNIAIALRKVLPKYKTAAILDIDLHHGNGTQDIFLGNKNVLYCSIHQSPLFPGTGLNSEQNCINFPLPAWTEEDVYLKYLDKCIEEIKRFNPGILAVSAGFDTYENDPIGGFKLKAESYKKIGEKINDLNIPAFFVLEGGYSEGIGKLVLSFAEGLKK